MFRLLSILVLSALCTLPDRVSADTSKPHERVRPRLAPVNGARAAHGVFITGAIGRRT